MPGNGKLVFDSQDGFSGGWSLQANGLLGPGQYTSPLNVRVNTDGDIQPRQGTRKAQNALFGGGQAIVAGYTWRHPDGSVDELLVMADGHLWRASYSDGTGQPVLGSITDIGGSPGNISNATTIPTSFATFRNLAGNDRVYIADGANGISYVQGSAFLSHAVGAPAVPFRYIWVYNHRLYGVTGTNELIYWSALDDGDSLGVIGSGGGFATIRTFGGQVLTGGVAIGPTNVLSHQGALSMFRGLTTDDIAIDTGSMGISSIIGIPSPRAICVHDNHAYAMTTQGAAILTGAQIQLLDQPGRQDPLLFDPAYPKGFLPTVLAAGDMPFVVRNTRMKEIWFGATGSAGYPVYVWSYRYNCWIGKFDFHSVGGAKAIRSIWETKNSAGTTQLLYGSSDGYVRTTDAPEGGTIEIYKDDANQDGTGGNSFPWAVYCRRFWCNNLRATKGWNNVMVNARLNGGQVNVNVFGAANTSGGNIVLNQPSYVPSSEHAAYRVNTMPKATQWMQVQLERDHADPKPVVSSVTVEAEIVGDRGV